jgi:hypothetical protein
MEPRWYGKLGEREYDPTGVAAGSDAWELWGRGVPWPDLSEMALLASCCAFCGLLAWSRWSSSCCCLIICSSRFWDMLALGLWRLVNGLSTYDVHLLLSLELLMKLAQAGSSVMVGIGRGGRPRQELRARGMARLVGGHLAGSGNGGIVDLQVHEDRSSAAGLRGSAMSRQGAGGGAFSSLMLANVLSRRQDRADLRLEFSCWRPAFMVAAAWRDVAADRGEPVGDSPRGTEAPSPLVAIYPNTRWN